MAATALAQPSRARTAPPAKRPTAPRRPARRAAPAPAPAPRGLGAIADSRLIVRLTASQAWIAIVGAALAGIVAINVINLGMGAGVSGAAERAAELEQRNSLLRERIGGLRRNTKIETSAAKLGLGQPSSSELVRLTSRKTDAKRAAERLTAGLAGTAVAAPAVADPATAVAPAPTTPAPVEPAAAVTAAEPVAEPTAPAPEAAAPITPTPETPPPAVAAGGVAP